MFWNPGVQFCASFDVRVYFERHGGICVGGGVVVPSWFGCWPRQRRRRQITSPCAVYAVAQVWGFAGVCTSFDHLHKFATLFNQSLRGLVCSVVLNIKAKVRSKCAGCGVFFWLFLFPLELFQIRRQKKWSIFRITEDLLLKQEEALFVCIAAFQKTEWCFIILLSDLERETDCLPFPGHDETCRMYNAFVFCHNSFEFGFGSIHLFISAH